MSSFLGVDGGNTKTLAVVADENGCILGAGRAGNGDIYGAASAEAAMDSVAQAVRQAVVAAGVGPPAVGAFSMAGADWPEDYDFISGQVSRLCGRAIVVNDCIGALRSGAKDGVGLAVICGTYGTCGAQSRDGKRWCGGFWHRADGGAVPLGHAAWDAVLDAELGMAPPTALTEAALRFYRGVSVEELLHRLNRHDGKEPPTWGAFARVLFEVALEGDPAAIAIVRAHGTRAGEYAIAAVEKVGLLDQPFPLILTGGTMRFTPNPLREVIVETVLRRFPSAVPTDPRFQPVIGALMLAYDAVGIAVDASIETNLCATCPGGHFFDS